MTRQYHRLAEKNRESEFYITYLIAVLDHSDLDHRLRSKAVGILDEIRNDARRSGKAIQGDANARAEINGAMIFQGFAQLMN